MRCLGDGDRFVGKIQHELIAALVAGFFRMNVRIHHSGNKLHRVQFVAVVSKHKTNKIEFGSGGEA